MSCHCAQFERPKNFFSRNEIIYLGKIHIEDLIEKSRIRDLPPYASFKSSKAGDAAMPNNGEQNLIGEYLYPREQARQILGGISIATLVRLEKAGVLKPIRLNKHSPTAQVFYTGFNLRELTCR
jgi:hypothetical protein